MMKKQALNPFLPIEEYIPDGEPHIFGDRLYLFGSHDKEAVQIIVCWIMLVGRRLLMTCLTGVMKESFIVRKMTQIIVKNWIIFTRLMWYRVMTGSFICTIAFREKMALMHLSV